MAIDISKNIDSLTNFRRATSSFVARLKESGQPIVLTINGKAEIVVQDAAAYQRLLELAQYVEEVEAIRQGITDANEGRTISVDDLRKRLERLARRHGLHG